MSLMAATTERLVSSDLELIASYVPPAVDKILRSKQATATFVEHAKHAKAEIRELTVAFCSFHGIDVADSPERAQHLVNYVDWAVRHASVALISSPAPVASNRQPNIVSSDLFA